MKISTGCSQTIVNKCTFNALSNFAWWMDRNGNKIEYWNGNLNENAKGCKCAQTASCESDFGPGGLCNCDNRGISSDSGILTSMSQLPVMELNYGDSEYRHSWIEYDLGPLRCYGKDYFYPSEISASTMNFKAAYEQSVDHMYVIEEGEFLKFPDIITDDTLNSLSNNSDIFKVRDP